MKPRKIKVALLVGGPSSEHDVSLSSGKVVHDNLDPEKYEITPIIIGRKGEWPLEPEVLPSIADVVFIVMHGEYGEDGQLQEVLRDLDIPYVWSDVMASALAMNKPLAYRAFRARGVRVPEAITITEHDLDSLDLEDIHLPAVVKPADRGSSVGVSIVRRVSELGPAIQKSFAFSKRIMIEKFISGRELTCGVLDDGAGNVFPLPVTEIIPRTSNFFDYQAKYTAGASDEITPARLNEEETDRVKAIAVQAHEAIGASGASRTDFILGDDGELYVLEVNTIPGMTETSLLPQGAAAHGISMPELLDRLIDAAFVRHKSLDLL